MRFLVILALLALLAVVVVLLVYGLGGRRARPAPARWETRTESSGGVTVVLVRRVSGEAELDRQVVAEIPDGAPDWETRYHEAMAQARSRVAALDVESG